MQSSNPRLIAPMSFLAMLPPAGSAWGTALASQAGTQPRYQQQSEQPSMSIIEHLNHFEVVELRRYTVADGKRQQFANYFESFFPEAFQQLGAIVFGSFLERDNANHFTWLRGYHDINARAIVNSAFYYGPLWKEHRTTMNEILPDSDNVLLLRPLRAERGVTVLPAVDPVMEPEGAEGIVVAQIFAVETGSTDAFAQQAEPVFARYRAAGIREVGLMVTLDVPNNFPQLPVRSDGPYLVWLGIVEDEQTLQSVCIPLESSNRQVFIGTGLLRAEPEWIVMQPTRRSRLRWLVNQQETVATK